MTLVIHVAGTSFRQTEMKHCKAGDPVRLVPEPTNAYDPNAVKVCRGLGSGDGGHIGYIPKSLAERWHGQPPPHERAFIKEILGGTPDKPTLGAFIELET